MVILALRGTSGSKRLTTDPGTVPVDCDGADELAAEGVAELVAEVCVSFTAATSLPDSFLLLHHFTPKKPPARTRTARGARTFSLLGFDIAVAVEAGAETGARETCAVIGPP